MLMDAQQSQKHVGRSPTELSIEMESNKEQDFYAW